MDRDQLEKVEEEFDPTARDIFTMVYVLPAAMTRGFCHQGPIPITFGNVDWFNHKEGMSEESVRAFVLDKGYIDSRNAYLVISSQHTFLIQPENLGY